MMMPETSPKTVAVRFEKKIPPDLLMNEMAFLPVSILYSTATRATSGPS